MKKTITLICFAFMAVCLTNAQEMVRSIKTNDWELILKKDMTYFIEPFGDKVTVKDYDYLQFITLPETLIFTSKEPQEPEGVLINGVRWATRNLASHGKFVEKPEDYGALFQWGRKGDGHEQRTSPNYPTNNYSEENGVVSGAGLDANGQIVSTHAAYGKFIKQDETPYDWRSPQINTLWNSGNETTPVKTANDPCPAGWRLPTQAELQSLINAGSKWGESNGVSGRYFGTVPNQIFLPAAGGRDHATGGVLHSGEYGFYWSSAVTGIYARYLGFYDGIVRVYGGNRAIGFSVRCVSDQ